MLQGGCWLPAGFHMPGHVGSIPSPANRSPKMDIEKEKMKDGVALVQELKKKMEKDIAKILENFEVTTGLKPGIVFHEKTAARRYLGGVPINPDIEDFIKYKVNVPVHF